MKRFAITALVIGVVAGCAGAAPTPAPTSTPRPTSTPSPTSTPRPTSTPSPTSTPESSEIFLGITGFTQYTSAVYGVNLGYPDGWSLGAAATRKWQPGDQGDTGWSDWFGNPSDRDGEDIVFGVWQQPAGSDADITSREGLAAWVATNGMSEAGMPMCLGKTACLPAILVPGSDGIAAYFADAETGFVTIVSLGRHDSFFANARYGGGVQLLKSILTTMDVWTPEPGQILADG